MMDLKLSTVSGAMLLATAVALTGCGGGKGGGSDDCRLGVACDTFAEDQNGDDQNGDDQNGDDQNGDELGFCDDPDQLFTLDVTSIFPADGDTNVAPNRNITMTFSHEPALAPLQSRANVGLNDLSDAPNRIIVGLTPLVEGVNATFFPEDPHLLENTSYEFYINALENGIEAAECAGTGEDPKFLTFVDGNGDPLVVNNQPVTEVVNQFDTGDQRLLEILDVFPEENQAVGESAQPSITFSDSVLLSSIDCTGPEPTILIEKIDVDPETSEETRTRVEGTCVIENEGGVDDSKITFVPADELLDIGDYEFTIFVDRFEPNSPDVIVDPELEDRVIRFRVTDCEVPLSSLCVLAGDSDEEGIVELLLDPENGPLGPIAGQIGGREELAEALIILLESDGDLQSLLENLLLEGNLEAGLERLLLGDENGEGGLADILEQLLLGDGEEGGLEGLLGEEGVAGLLQALLIDPDDEVDCQAPLGNVCLIAGEDSDRQGVLDLIASDGALSSTGITGDELLEALGMLLESDGSLPGLIENLFLEGQLEEGLTFLLLGNEDEGGLVAILEDLLNLDAITDGLTCVVNLLLGQTCD